MQFHESPLGRRFLERDMPQLVKQLTTLSDSLRRIAAAMEASACSSGRKGERPRET